MPFIKTNDGTEIFYRIGAEVSPSCSAMVGRCRPMTGARRCYSSSVTAIVSSPMIGGATGDCGQALECRSGVLPCGGRASMPKRELFRLRTESKMLRWEGERFAAIAGEHRLDSLGPPALCQYRRLLAVQARRLIRLNGSGQKFKPSHRSVVQFDYKLFPTYNIA